MEKQVVTRLEQAWSSADVGAFLDESKLHEIMVLFHDMEPSAKVRLLLAIQTAQQEHVKQQLSRERHGGSNSNAALPSSLGLPEDLLKQILSKADADSDEWVRIGSGILRRMLFTDSPDDDYLAQSVQTTVGQVMALVDASGGGEIAVDDWFSHDLAYMTPHPNVSLQGGAASKNDHFTVVEEGRPLDDVKKGAPSLHTPLRSSSSGAAVRRGTSSVSISSSSFPPKPHATAPSSLKRSLTEMGSEIRRQAENGRFKRNRSRISVIDLDEVKQIEADKVLKAEERKQLARRGPTKSAAAATVAATVGDNDAKAAAASSSADAAASAVDTQDEFHQAALSMASLPEADAGHMPQGTYLDYGGMMQYDESYLQGEDAAASAAVAAVAAHARLPVFNDPYQYVDQQGQQQQQQQMYQQQIHMQQQAIHHQQQQQQQSMAFPFDSHNALYQQPPPPPFSTNAAEFPYNAATGGGFLDSTNNTFWR